MKFLKTSSGILSRSKISTIEKSYSAKYICDTCIKGHSGWVNQPSALFYTDAITHQDHSNWFAMTVVDGRLMISNGKSCVDPSNRLIGIKTSSGILYSTHRHDYKYHEADDVAIDGGRDYVKIIGSPKKVELFITKDGLAIGEEIDNAV